MSEGLPLEREAQFLLSRIYGQTNPAQTAELEYQLYLRARRNETQRKTHGPISSPSGRSGSHLGCEEVG